jgi:TetR/AcrR family transcriptional repressor of nem operon
MHAELSPKADEIVVCARSLIAMRGYNGFSYADISAAVGISKPSVHHHFASKAELVRVVVSGYREQARLGLARLDRDVPDPLMRLRAWFGFWQACLRDRTLPMCICAMLASEMSVLPAAVGIEVKGHFDDVCGWLASLLTQGVHTRQWALHRSAPQEALALLAAVHGAMVSARAYDHLAVFADITATLLARLTQTPDEARFR